MILQYCGVNWTVVNVNKRIMTIRIKNNGEKNYEDVTVPDEMRIWLHQKTGEVQTSYIKDSHWWWDRKPLDSEYLEFYFRDPNVALMFKLTWGGTIDLQSNLV